MSGNDDLKAAEVEGLRACMRGPCECLVQHEQRFFPFVETCREPAAKARQIPKDVFNHTCELTAARKYADGAGKYHTHPPFRERIEPVDTRDIVIILESCPATCLVPAAELMLWPTYLVNGT
jgi:hypothetical protein